MIPNPLSSRETSFWQAQGLGRNYGRRTVLQDVSFSLGKGQVLGLFGPNGSGKSTLLDVVALAARPSAGRILLNGEDILPQARSVRPLIGYVPQDIALFEELTVMDNLLCWTRLPGKQAKVRIAEISSALCLDVITRQKVATLSGGMKRRVNLAVALLGRPALLVLDEPFSGVDLEHREIMLNYLKLLARQGVSQIISGHSLEDLQPLVDQIMILRDGRIFFYDDLVVFLRQAAQADRRFDPAILNGSAPCGS